MSTLDAILVGLFASAGFLAILSVGAPREPVSRSQAAFAVAIDVVLILAIVKGWGR